MQPLNLATIHTRSRQQIADDAYRLHGVKVDLASIRNEAYYRLKSELIAACSQARNAKQLQQFKLAIGLGIKVIQENINHAGYAGVNFKKSAAQIYDLAAWALLVQLVAGKYKADLELVCRPRNTLFNCNYKFSWWDTNYTNSASWLLESVTAYSPFLSPDLSLEMRHGAIKLGGGSTSRVVSEAAKISHTVKGEVKPLSVASHSSLSARNLLNNKQLPYLCQHLGDIFRRTNGRVDCLQPRVGGTGQIHLEHDQILKFAATRFCWADNIMPNLVTWVSLQQLATTRGLVWVKNSNQQLFYFLHLNANGEILQQQVLDWNQAQQLFDSGWGYSNHDLLMVYQHLSDLHQFCQIGISDHYSQDLSFIATSDERLAQTTVDALKYLAQLPLATLLSTMMPDAHPSHLSS